MAILATERTESVKKSVEYYLYGNFTTTAVSWQGTKFDTTAYKEYIEPRIINYSVDYAGKEIHSGSTVHALRNRATLNINIFVDVNRRVNAGRVNEIGDILCNLLGEKNITWSDYETDGYPALGVIRTREAVFTPLAEIGGIERANVSADFEWISKKSI